MNMLVIACMLFFFAPAAHAASPAIHAVTGDIADGQAITVTGVDLVQEDKSNWDPFFKTSAYSFEGKNFFADGYTTYTGDPGAVYDSDVKLLGKQSARFHLPSAASCKKGGNTGMAPLRSNTYFMRAYVRYDVPSGIWPDNHLKLFGAQTRSMLAYIQPHSLGPPPTHWVATLNGEPHYAPNPAERFRNGRWYLVEVHQSPTTYTVWIDNTEILSVPFIQSGPPMSFEIGIINACRTSHPVTVWIDGFTLSSSRIHPAALIEIGNSPVYGAGKVKYQEPVYLSDASITFKADLDRLGNGPYYLWITNNRGERSAGYLLEKGKIKKEVPKRKFNRPRIIGR